ncbi:MAG: hypothetical protein M1815_002773 [Lichina confinis]|nr:MAG: hypothetical protein M1815_002773 [Lichina confinis]
MSAGKPIDLDTTPLRAPPPGVKPNFTNPESRGSEYKFLYVFILVVSAAFTFLRMYTRIWVTRCVGADDWVAAAGLVNYAVYLLYIPTNVCIKSSVFLLYLRLFDVARRLRTVAWLLLASLVLFHIAAFFAVAFQCTPLKKWFNPLLEGKCINHMALGKASAAQNIFIDVSAFLLPIPEILKLRISTRKKAQLVALFSLGLLVAEQGLALVCACAPVLPIFFRSRVAPLTSKWTGSGSGSGSERPSNSGEGWRPAPSSWRKKKRTHDTHGFTIDSTALDSVDGKPGQIQVTTIHQVERNKENEMV